MSTGVLTLNVVGVSNPILINLNQFHFGVGLIATYTPGNATAVNFGAQVTGDNPNQTIQPGVTPNPFTHWNNHDVLVNLTASANDSLRYPCTAMRLIVTSVTTPGNVAWTGNVALAVIQTGSM